MEPGGAIDSDADHATVRPRAPEISPACGLPLGPARPERIARPTFAATAMTERTLSRALPPEPPPPEAPLEISPEASAAMAVAPQGIDAGAPAAGPVPPTSAFARGAAAYASLAAGDRRAAADGFAAAFAAGPGEANAPLWARAGRSLRRRWSGEAYWLFRDGAGSGLGATPVLGGAQAGAALGYTIDPLARRPLTIVTRATGAVVPGRGFARPRGIDRDSVQLALGLRWRPLPGVSLTAERLVAAGAAARDDWTLRAAAGAMGAHGHLAWSAYGEAGVLGRGDSYAGGQARAGWRLAAGPATVSAGAGTWASVQYAYAANAAIGRIDVGPSVGAHLPLGRGAIDASIDYRWRIGGAAAPRSGPALTVSAGF